MTRIHCDYFKFTVPTDLDDAQLDQLCQDLFGYPFRRFDKLYMSRDRYANCFTLGNHVNVYRQGFAANKGTTCFDIPGPGLRELHIDVIELCRYVVEQGGNVCRFDVTADDVDGILPFDEIVELCTGDSFKERVRTKLCRNRKDSMTGKTLQVLPDISIQPRRILLGSPKSDNYAVIYDKEYCTGAQYPFLRVELRLTNRQDTAALASELATGTDPTAYLAGIIRGKLDFLRLDNAKKERRSSMPWWGTFLAKADARKLKREKTKSDQKPAIIGSLTVAQILKGVARLKKRGNSEDLQRVITSINEDEEARRIAWPEVINF